MLCALAAVGALETRTQFDELIASKAEAATEVAVPTDDDVTEFPVGPVTVDGSGSSLEPIDPALRTESTKDPNVPWVFPESSGSPWSDQDKSDGLLTFRGNPTRTFYGSGPIPESPQLSWTANIGCSSSAVGTESKIWCGTGWTGQPAIFRPPGQTNGWWLAVGGYNKAVNFYDPRTGETVYDRYETGDIIKGSVSADPDGFPLLYTGSRDGFFHIVAMDQDEPTVLWKLSADAIQPTKWNNDWDSSALVLEDFLFVGGENSRFFIIKLNRNFDANNNVIVNPEIVFSAPSWDDQILADVGDEEMSIENSIAISGDVVYFTNSAGLVQGWSIKGLESGVEPERVFRYWTGDDTDASIVIDDEGMLYIGSEFERGTARSRELGQVIKLDPSNEENPVVWSREANNGIDSGVWATPALYEDLVIVSTNDGRVLGLDRATGDQRWVLDLPGPLWSSPIVIDGVLLQGDCDGFLHAFEIVPDATPVELWEFELGGCIESTPAVWGGEIFVGSRNGDFYAIND